MPEYIEREATIELLRSLGSRDYRREKGTIQEAIKMVSFPKYTPSADVAPVRHGRWKCNQPCPVCGGTDLRGLMLIYGPIGSRLIAQTAAQRWTEVKIDERRYAGSLRGNRERYVPH